MSDQGSFNFDSQRFDQAAGQERKEAGMGQAADNRAELLEYARKLAETIALVRVSRECSIDDVFRVGIPQGIRPEELGNAAGSLFQQDKWEFTGRWKQSRRVSNHARCIRVWKLREKYQ